MRDAVIAVPYYIMRVTLPLLFWGAVVTGAVAALNVLSWAV